MAQSISMTSNILSQSFLQRFEQGAIGHGVMEFCPAALITLIARSAGAQ